MKAFYCMAFLALVSIHVTAQDALPVADLDAHRALWDSHKLTKVSYTLKAGGPFGYTEYKIRITGEKCVARSRSGFGSRRGMWRADSCVSHRMPELFKKVKDQLLSGFVQAKIRFNPDYGYIEFFSVEPDTDVFDQGWYIEVSRFDADKEK